MENVHNNLVEPQGVTYTPTLPLFIVDINTLPVEYLSEETLSVGLKKYEDDFKVRIIPVDFSKVNSPHFVPVLIK